MPIPKDKDRKAKKNKQLRKLQRATIEEDKAIRDNLRQALIHAIESDNGNAEATEDMRASLADAVENGLAKNAITIGGGMVSKLTALIGKPPAHSHAVGLLLNAAFLISQFDATLGASIKADAESIADADPAEVEQWRNIATPVRDIVGIQ